MGGLIITGIHPISFSSLLFSSSSSSSSSFSFLFFKANKQHTHFSTIDPAPRVFSCHREIIATTTALPFPASTLLIRPNPLLPGQELLCQLRICFGHLVSDSRSGPRVPNTTPPSQLNPRLISTGIVSHGPLPPDSPPGCRVSACVHDKCVCAIRAHRHIDCCTYLDLTYTVLCACECACVHPYLYIQYVHTIG